MVQASRIAEPEKNAQIQRMACPDDAGIHQPINRVNTTSRLQQLRVAMSAVKLVRGAPLKAYIVTSDDEHQVYIILAYTHSTHLIERKKENKRRQYL